MRELRVDVSRETRDQLEALVHTLGRWQKAINLIGKATIEDIWIRHILEFGAARAADPAGGRALADLGSGGGFPGLVLAALRPELAGHPDRVRCPERRVPGRGRPAHGPEEPAENRGFPDRGRPARRRRCRDGPGAGAARPIAGLGCATPSAIPLFAFSTKGKAGRLRSTEAKKDWDFEAQPFSSVTDRDSVLLRISQFSAKGLRHR